MQMKLNTEHDRYFFIMNQFKWHNKSRPSDLMSKTIGRILVFDIIIIIIITTDIYTVLNVLVYYIKLIYYDYYCYYLRKWFFLVGD